MKPLLAIDTSSERAFVALGSSAHSQAAAGSGSNSHIEELALLVQKVCSQANLRLQDLAGIIVGAGPGSFTGLRIGFSFAKGLSCALQLPLQTVSSLQAAAYATPEAVRLLVPIADARRSEVFWAAYLNDGESEMRQIHPPEIVPIVELERKLEILVKRHSGLSLEEAALVSLGGISTPPVIPGVKLLETPDLALGALRYSAQCSSDFEEFSYSAVAQLEPEYLREVAAKTIAQRQADSLTE